MPRMKHVRPGWWGNPVHVVYTIVVFIVLASLDNAALAMIPSMVLPLSDAFGITAGAIGLLTAATFLVAAITAVGGGDARE